jgi:AcrR family transcriptional regulator
LLAAARTLFAKDGYDGTSVRAITSLADANLGSITYHFGSKQRLYREVLTDVAEPLRIRVDAAGQHASTPLDHIEAIVRAFFEHFSRVPDMPALMLRELASDRPPPPPVRRVMGSIFETLSIQIRAGQRDGSIVPANPLHLAVSIVSQPIYVALAARPLREVLGFAANDRATRARVVDSAVRFVRRGLSTSGRGKP